MFSHSFSFNSLKPKYKYAIIGVLFIFTFFLGYWLKQYFININHLEVKQEKHETGFRYISPLLECINDSASDYKNLEIKEKLQNLIKSETAKNSVSHVSIYLRDLNNGPWIGINEYEKFSPASLMKVPLLISYLKIAETNPEILNKVVVINISDTQVLRQNILPLKHVEYNKSYTINQLLDYMIRYSDNVAAGTLLENIDPVSLNKIYRDLNLNVPTGDEENFMTVYEYAAFFRLLYNSSYLDRAMSEKALSLLTESTFTNGLVAGVPSNTQVSHKFGERILANAKQLHDCGIVYRENHNYLVCIMTRGNDFIKMENSIKALSKLIYDNF